MSTSNIISETQGFAQKARRLSCSWVRLRTFFHQWSRQSLDHESIANLLNLLNLPSPLLPNYYFTTQKGGNTSSSWPPKTGWINTCRLEEEDLDLPLEPCGSLGDGHLGQSADMDANLGGRIRIRIRINFNFKLLMENLKLGSLQALEKLDCPLSSVPTTTRSRSRSRSRSEWTSELSMIHF